MPLASTDWRWSISPGDRIRYLVDGLTYKHGTVDEIEFCEDDIACRILFTNGDEIYTLIKDIQQPLEEE